MHVILVVEDDDAIRSNLARVLALEGFEASLPPMAGPASHTPLPAGRT